MDQERRASGRREDRPFVTGAGCFTSDIALERMAHAKIVRAQHAHARIVGIDAAQARATPGVLAVYTAADLAADGIADLSQGVELRGPNDRPPLRAPRPVLARDRVRHLGEPLAIVVAETAAIAADAADCVTVTCEALPALATAAEARAPGAQVVWDAAPDNLGFVWRHGGWGQIDDALRNAARTVRHTFRVSRVVANPMEMRAAVGAVDADGRLVLHIGHQQPWALRDALARDVFRLDPAQVRIVVPDVGGSFGLKTGVHCEEVLVLWAARRLRRPVSWVATRAETFLGDDHSRDIGIDVTLGLDAAARFTALKVCYDLNVGCYISGRSIAPINNIGGVAGVYRIPLIAAEVQGVMTHTTPTGPYRGAGRPEATFAIERIIDLAARDLGMDPLVLRERNLIGADEMPYRTALTFNYDCGEFAGNMRRAAELADVAGFPARRRDARARGRLRGLGVCNLIEAAGGPFGRPVGDAARVQVLTDGTVRLTSGVVSTGQGIVTTLAWLLSERLGVPEGRIVVQSGDTDDLPRGRGNGGSSALSVSGAAVNSALDRLIENAHALAAAHLEAAPADIRFAEGRFAVIGTDHACTLADLATLAERRGEAGPDGPGLAARADFQPADVTFPNGCHICEVEVDPETGAVQVLRYTAVEDIGRVLSPVLVEGQLHGGIAQGIGQAVGENVVHEQGSAQLLTGSFMDYAMPRADDMPVFETGTREVLTRVNPLGAKGVGEAGTVGSLVVTINAICDALAELGVLHIDMPATPARVWSAIAAARGEGAQRS